MPHHQIDYIELPALDIPGTRLFYSTVFGWTFTDYGPAYTSFHDGRIGGGFAQATGPEAIHPTGGPLAVIYSKHLEATQAAVLAAGGRIVKEIFSFPGGRRFQFADPSGNELAVWSE